MKKIYMKNNNKQSTFQQVFQSQLSKKLTASMVLVAFFSFLLIGVGNVSYAAPVTIPEDGLGDSFTTQLRENFRILGSASNNQTFTVEGYQSTTGIPIFCLERNVGFAGDTVLTKSNDAITDQGLLYTMAKTYPHEYFKYYGKDTQFPDQVQVWLTQAAIWQYLYETGADQNLGKPEELQTMQDVRSIYWEDDDGYHVCDIDGCYTSDIQADSTATFYDTYIAPIVKNAKQATSVNGQMTISKANDEMSMTDDGYYQTSLITVSNTAPSNLVSFKVRIDGAPDGTIIVDEEGQEVEDTTGLEKFYVRIPADKVTEDNKDMQIAVDGTFRGYEGYYYRATGAQTVSTVYTTDVPHTAYLPINITYTPEVPDTGMNLAQSIYFIGLIVLLCGVGIIYANTKPKQRQQ